MGKSLLKYIISIVTFTALFLQATFVENVNAFQNINPKSLSWEIKKVQALLFELKLYKWNIDWEYNNVKNDIINFQVENKIIPSENDESAWYLWPKTYAVLQDTFWDNFSQAYEKAFWIKIVNSTAIWTEKKFIVSAYYSPLPGQKRYATWSYARDIRLNWNWTHWASWVGVHPWFIAAPSNYSFWTKIQLEWLWVWTVEDRWWAIVRAWVRWHEYDRLDVWMWYWDAGLTKALNWWKRTVKWKILSKGAENTIQYSGTLQVSSNSLAIMITPNSSSANIKLMQQYFSEAKLYTWKINGKYSSFKESIVDFQINSKVLPTRTSLWHWYIWKKTITQLEKIHPNIFLRDKREVQIEKKVIKKQGEEQELKNKKDNKKTLDKKASKVATSDKVKKKYNITDKQKKEVEEINWVINKVLKKKFWKDRLKLKTQKNKLNKKILVLIEKVKKESTKEKLKYLYDLLKTK